MDRPHWSNWLSIFIATMALVATVVSVMVSRSNQQTALFADFQEEYSEVAARFPPRLLDENFRPAKGSDEYKRLEDYWIFAYAEWFATEKNTPIFGTNLWSTYYAGLVTDATEVPSLRYVLQDMMREKGTRRKDFAEFFGVVSELAKKGGKPLQ